MLLQPFLTDLDSRAAIKGSRDPLGTQSIWTRLGRYVVGNLTTVSSQVRDFTVTLLGYHFVERVTAVDRDQSELSIFLKWEQLAAYARGGINGDWAFRGTERAQKSYRAQDPPRVRLSTDPAHQILGNQKIYGLWGLYTVPSRTSGLLDGADPPRLTPASRELLDRVYLPALARAGVRDGDAIVERLRVKDRELNLAPSHRDHVVVEAVAKVLQRRILESERPFYREHLLLGGTGDRTAGAQHVLADVIRSTFSTRDWVPSPPAVLDLAKQAAGRSEVGDRLAARLTDIAVAEQVMAPAVALFELALSMDGQPVAALASRVADRWKGGLRSIDLPTFERLEPEIRAATGDAAMGARWVEIARCLALGDYQRVIAALLEQNRDVMLARAGAAPWIAAKSGALDVRFRDEEATWLPDATDIPTHWRHPYFLASLRDVARALEAT